MRQRSQEQLQLVLILLVLTDVANSVGGGDAVANFAQKLDEDRGTKKGDLRRGTHLSADGKATKGLLDVTRPKISAMTSQQGPMDLLMDHDVDFIEDNITWKWCLLAISGNATIVKLRRNDFVKYLKMNVASLVGTEYDFVRVTSISYTPYVLVNVSLDWNEATEPRIVKSLTSLASHNDTLLDLSGEHFNLTDFLPASALLSPKALSPLEERDAAAAAAHPRQMEAMIYLVIGVTIAFLITATFIFTVCHCLSKPGGGNPSNSANMTASTKLTSDDELDRRSSSRQTFNRHSYLQQSPLTEETISLEDFEAVAAASGNGSHHHLHHRRSVPKLIYTQEFSDGLMVLPTDEDIKNADDSLAPLATFDADEGCVPHQFVLRNSRQRHSHHGLGGRHHIHLQEQSNGGAAQLRRSHFNQNGGGGQRARPMSEMVMASSPMSEIHPRIGSSRNGSMLPPRPNSVLEDPSYFPPLSPPPDFHSGYMSDVPTMTLPTSSSASHHHRRKRPETPLVLSSFKPGIPSISQPTPEEIQRDVDIVFHNLGLDSQSPMRMTSVDPIIPPPPPISSNSNSSRRPSKTSMTMTMTND